MRGMVYRHFSDLFEIIPPLFPKVGHSPSGQCPPPPLDPDKRRHDMSHWFNFQPGQSLPPSAHQHDFRIKTFYLCINDY